ncbi:MAG: hypothetical protein KGJ15_00570 [Betaproteobacteria bacterium]|nr:hypothetical protein [Betaproteobacteria bacterium]MDE2131229.1 hypothetical protein [Betaproteobacteria bacterium]
MAILTNIIAAYPDDIEALGESLHPLDEWSGIEMRDVDTAKITTLHCLLTGDLFDDAIIRYEPVYVSPAEGALVLQVADELMDRLARLDEDHIEAVAAELAATEEFESEEWREDEILAMLMELVELAQRAESQGQEMFVWMHPLRT